MPEKIEQQQQHATSQVFHHEFGELARVGDGTQLQGALGEG